MRTAYLLSLALLSFATAKPLLAKRWTDFTVKHAWDDVPKGWTYHAPAPAAAGFTMRIALKQDKFDDLVTALYEVSDPAHEK